MISTLEHQTPEVRRNYLKALVALVSADGHLDERELALLQEIGKRRGLKGWQIEEVMHEPLESTSLPKNLDHQLTLLYDLAELMHIDATVDQREVEFLQQTVAKLGLPATLAQEYLELFRHGSPNSSQWREFVQDVRSQIQPGIL